MDALRSLVQPLVGGGGGNNIIDGMKLVVLGTTVETARRVASSGWNHFVNSFFLTAHFSEEDYPYDWLMLWLSRRPEWQRSREFETTTRTAARSPNPNSTVPDNSFGDDDDNDNDEDGDDGRVRTRVVFQPTFDTTHTIYYRGHWLRVRRSRSQSSYNEMLSISVVARNNSILKQLVLQAKREYEAESVHRIQIYFADSHGSWRWTDSRHKRPMSSIVLNPGVKEMLLADAKDFLKSEKWYADRGIPFRRGYLLYGVPGSGKSSLIHAIAGELLLDVYVVSLSSSWINDATLTALMGRVPSRCIVLLEDLDAAFTRSTSREEEGANKDKAAGPDNQNSGSGSSRRRNKEQLSDVNTLSLSGLLNALDGVAASEGRLLFATTNHLEKLDPALSRPGRMDVWIEFKNASRWQAEQLFRNFFPSSDPAPEEAEMNLPTDEAALDAELGDIKLNARREAVPETPTKEGEIPLPPTPSAEVLSASGASSASLASLPSTTATKVEAETHEAEEEEEEEEKLSPEERARRDEEERARIARLEKEHAIRHVATPLSNARLAALARKFAESIPDEEFSVAALQGYLLKNKTRPEEAANGAAAWVISEREMKVKLKKEKEAREAKEKAEREKRRKEKAEEEKKKVEEDKTKTEEQKKKDAEEAAEKAKAEEAKKEDEKKENDAEESGSQSSSSDDEGENVPATPAENSTGTSWNVVSTENGGSGWD
ncbi:P-loop containing nucleoside triphosphate hydrolase protein [Punctularia strigosozonata HHB-11173 SS5]|uniref:P-loop containing nucleoside triphosphate hydrolase protein n=1 Tax=Punctularia strigosozonata (strain HHB-11173) TaxID=741275 RepID=UPI000441729F|nr:P-loop containing nucleoside triphosphate hydrolase protein [Punctularia strigosozonata HHB-11173 SS5]EIN11141.1 P-loop containing nucleoside triphosphate hydrolase protein [Punctularia strigosozonata HHB-11173 SS5]